MKLMRMNRITNLIKRRMKKRLKMMKKKKMTSLLKISSISTDDEDETNNESKVEDKAKGDDDKIMDYTTNQFKDDVNVRLNEPVDADEGLIQNEGTDAEMINVQQGNENPEITLTTNPSSALPNFAYVFQFNNRVTVLEKEVAELKKGDTLNTQVTALVDEHIDLRQGATKDEFMNYLSASITARIAKQVKIQLL
ncbi:hypothetical protein Tco_0076997, partial [Tanacetum coccineum]